MNLVLHIGTEKTGTTSIQELFHCNREFLNRQGFYYLKSLGERNHRALASYGMPERNFDDYFRALNISTEEQRRKFDQSVAQELSAELRNLPAGIHTVIASSEHFHSRCTQQAGIEKLAALLRPHFSNIKIVVYLRQQVDVAISLYSTALKGGASHQFDAEFLQRNCTPTNYYYNYQALLGQWAKVFGETAIRPRLFDPEEFVHHDLIADMLAVCGIAEEWQDVSIIRPAPLNESLSPFGQLLLRELNRSFPRGQGNSPENPQLGRLRNEIIRLCPGSNSIDSQVAIWIQSTFTTVNEAVRQRWFPDRKQLFTFRAEKYSPRPTVVSPTEEAVIQSIFAAIPVDSPQERDADSLRDAALALESHDLRQARKLMEIAARLRPSGTFIKKKLAEYELKLNQPGH